MDQKIHTGNSSWKKPGRSLVEMMDKMGNTENVDTVTLGTHLDR
jgi:hypothetical protein